MRTDVGWEMGNGRNDLKARRWLNRNVGAMGFTSLFSDASHEMATSALPSFLTNLVGPVAAPITLGVISGLSDVSSSFVKVLSGWLSDKTGRRKPLSVLGYSLTGIFVGMIGFATNWFEVLLYRVLAWIGRGTREPPRDALLADSVEQTDYGHAFGFHRAMDTLGAIIGPILSFIFIPLIMFRDVFLISLIPGILAVIIFSVFIKEKKSKPKEEMKLVESIKNLPRRFKVFLFVMLVFGLGNFNRTLLLLRVEEIYTPTTGIVIASSLAVFFYIVRNITQAIADYTIGAVSDKVGKRIPLAFLGFFMFGLMCIGFTYVTPNLPFIILLFMLSGTSAAAVTALEKAYSADMLPTTLRGTGYGILNTLDGVGDFASSLIAGFLWTLFSSTASFWYGATFSFAATILLVTMLR
jgi:MFS family permease